MDIYAKVQSVVVLATAILGVVVTFWPPNSFKIKAALVFLFIVLGLTALFLQEQREKNQKAEVDKAQAELLNWQRGDPKNPPRFGMARNVNEDTQVLTVSFLMENPSQYPAYEINGRLWDLDVPLPSPPVSLEEFLKQDILAVNISSLAGNVVQILKTIELSPTQSSKRFAAQYSTRAGQFLENIRVDHINGKWLFAFQVRRLDASNELLFEQIDPDFPKDESGKVDWAREQGPPSKAKG
jgi:hypothetical protein